MAELVEFQVNLENVSLRMNFVLKIDCFERERERERERTNIYKQEEGQRERERMPSRPPTKRGAPNAKS